MKTPGPVNDMTLRSLLPFAAAFGAAVLATTLRAQNTQSLWSIPWSNAATIDSHVWTSPAANVEAADDFDVTGTITRIVVKGNGCSSCLPPPVTGATVRFYQWNQGAVGALQQEMFVPVASPGLSFVATLPETIDVTLPQPFAATGRHFVSVQMHFAPAGHWRVWVGNWGNPSLSSVKVRDRLGSNQWTTPTVYPWPSPQVIGDLVFDLWGLPQGVTGQPALPCITWSPLGVDATPNAAHNQLRDVKVFGVDDVWAVGHTLAPNGPNLDSLTAVLRWDGHRFSVVPSPSPGPAPGLVNCLLDAIDGTSSSDVWVAGTYNIQVAGGWVGQQAFAMHYDGQNWTVPPDLPLPNTSTGGGISGTRILDVKSIAANDVWFVGDWLDIVSPANPTTIRSGLLLHYDGSTLAQTLLPVVTGVGHQYFNAVAASASNDVWVVGGAGVADNLPGSTVPVVFHYDGSNWTHRTFPAPPGWLNLYDVEVVAPNDVTVFGTATSSGSPPSSSRFMAQWNGSTWSLLPGPPSGLAAKAFASSLIWSVGAGVHLWDGSQWLPQHDFSGTENATLAAVDGLFPCELYGVGGRFGTIVERFAARQDNSAAWNTRVRLPVAPQRAPCRLSPRTAVRPGEALAVGIDDPAGATTASGAPTFWIVGLAPAPANLVVGFGGANGGSGEVLVDPSTLGFFSTPVALPAAGPAVHTVQLPATPALIGFSMSSQGLLLDPAPPFHLLLTNALDLQIGW